MSAPRPVVSSAVGIERADTLVREGLQRVRRRLGRAARRRAHRLRVRLERADQGARVGPPDGVPRAVDALRALHRQAPRPLALPRAGGAARARCASATSPTMDRAFETYARAASIGCSAISRREYPRAPQDSERVHRAAIRAKALDTLRGHAARGDAVERRHLRHRPGLRERCCSGCARIRSPKCARAPTDMLAELRKVIPAFLIARRSARSRRALERVPRRHARANRGRRLAAARRRGGGAAGRSDAHRLRSRRRNQGRRRGALCGDDAARRSAAGASRAACRPTSAPPSFAPTSASAATAVISPAARSSAPATASTCSPTTARSATCSGTGC